MIHVMLPAYNEAQALKLLLPAFKNLFDSNGIDYRMVIVDDGSDDETQSVSRGFSEEMPIDLLVHDTNKGLGEAMKTGLGRLAESSADDDLVVTMDADNTHDPNLILKMKEKIDSDSGYDIIIASRYAEGGREVGLELLRKILSRGASLLLQIFFNVDGARDYTCGYRMYRASIIKKSFREYGARFIEEKSFVCMAEILIKAFYLGARVGEVSLVLRYDLKQSQSKLKKFRTILRYVRLMARGKRRIIRLRRT